MSRYEFLFHMRRHKRAAFFKIFLPPLFIALVVSIDFGEVQRSQLVFSLSLFSEDMRNLKASIKRCVIVDDS